MNVKLERLNHTFVKEISFILQEEIKDDDIKDDIKFVTITGCDITSDLSYAKVYFTCLNKENEKDMGDSLNHAASFIRAKLSERVDIRHTPALTFIADNSIEYGNKIEKIIEKINEE